MGAAGAEAIALAGRPDIAFVDLRETSERLKHGSIPGACMRPMRLQDNIRAGGMLRELARATDKRIVFYCAFGERSAMAVQAAQDGRHGRGLHVEGGIDAGRRPTAPSPPSAESGFQETIWSRSCCG